MIEVTQHPMAWLKLGDLAALTGYSKRSIQRKIARWKKDGLKALKLKGGEQRVQLKDWQAFMVKVQKKEIKL